ncbi:iron-containing redox enzyme family protein [Idiomarina loihiensis]|jgi:pyrroloquinoline quinone (PQQ) biosynthesis protein C|uniref:TenA family transcriptional regulator n=1 Tax=Idiomarina TaxID=135575 RepID=UPI0002F315A1|nr:MULTISPECIES: iron-containing redox enzyme family protein [unclassified Idiomarina]MAA61575.1 iron-containing redox enzyme family protein [Idiomarina sp.]MBL4855355.1 iron-containing redox enzyme family protein [Idiomarina sp.]NWO02010.1 iron-containing redox enzyme family protein [Idiomarinaceae bacterium]HAS22875.1 iron-containing redox enzyme family protein [Idiomarina loihiensis]|tara:strand:+ start:36077 stop:36754 length:678 start_codon:yes stop_codon:yes gene_type:complete
MSFFNTLCEQTQTEQQYLLSARPIQQALQGDISLPRYQAFLSQAYHHVKHTVPLLMRCGSRLSLNDEWLRKAVIEYIGEEYGHERWILNDLDAAGGDVDMVQNSEPHTPTQAMVSLVYNAIDNVHPTAFFGMAHVLEGTSVKLATAAAHKIQSTLGLPESAFSYLLSHGDLDQEHVQFFEQLMNRVEDADAQRAIIQTAKHVYRLYGDMFRALPELAGEQPEASV